MICCCINKIELNFSNLNYVFLHVGSLLNNIYSQFYIKVQVYFPDLQFISDYQIHILHFKLKIYIYIYFQHYVFLNNKIIYETLSSFNYIIQTLVKILCF